MSVMMNMVVVVGDVMMLMKMLMAMVVEMMLSEEACLRGRNTASGAIFRSCEKRRERNKVVRVFRRAAHLIPCTSEASPGDPRWPSGPVITVLEDREEESSGERLASHSQRTDGSRQQF